MAKQSVEEIKRDSRGLRGRIVETINSGASHFEEAEYQLMKFHGSYQQDDRDVRSARRKEKLDKAWSFMVRSKMPGGRLSAEQYLVHERLADEVGCGNLRLTTRQGIQLHGILIGDLKTVISKICKSGLTTLGACGDVVRNTMSAAAPIKDAVHEDCQKLAEEITETFLAKTCGYADIWLDGEKLEPLSEGDPSKDPEDPIYGTTYLPRKFKIAIAVPPRNDVDIFSNDVAMAPHAPDGVVEGYTLWIGGGFGMTHGKEATRPHLAKPFAYVERHQVIEVLKGIVAVQREYGHRGNRKLSRLKYVVQNTSMPWFRNAVKERVSKDIVLHEIKDVTFDTVSDPIGWYEQGDGKFYRGLHIAQGRIEDVEGGIQVRTALRTITEKLGLPINVTANCNLIICEVSETQKSEVEAILSEHNFPDDVAYTAMRQVAHACVSLPTCGLALAEAERTFGNEVLDPVDEILRDLGLENEPLLIRMTGCPNGCARPYNADIAFVGRGPKKYALYVGGSHRGNRLAGLYKKVILSEDIPTELRLILEDFATNRQEGETFTDFWGRTKEQGEEPDSSHFHVELEARTAARAEKKSCT